MTAASPVPPSLSGQRVFLRPAEPADRDWLYALETHPLITPHWRLRGSTPKPSEAFETFWAGILTAHIVHLRQSPERQVGLVTSYNADYRNRHCFIGAACTPDRMGSAIILEAVALQIDLLFETWDFRKLYLETYEFTFHHVHDWFGGAFVREAALKDFFYYNNRYWDRLFFSVSREGWEGHREQVDRVLGRFEQDPATADAREGDADRAAVELIGRISGESVPLSELVDDVRLRDDLRLDSIGLLEIWLWLEERRGDELPLDLMAGLITIGDVKHYANRRS